MRIAFATLGCKINQYETDQLRNDLSAQGNEIVPFNDQADVYIINTCTVTAKSDYQCRQMIRSASRRANGAQVIVTGCYATTRPDDIRAIPGVQWVVRNEEKQQIAVRLLKETVQNPRNEKGRQTTPDRRTRGFLKIQDGCDNRCSYCIVPDARGPSRSMPQQEVVAEFDKLVSSGCPEIVLTGIHIGMYGSDQGAGSDFDNLLTTLVQRRRGSRIRLSSIEPNEISDRLIGLVGNGLCRHLHIPLQSGSDRILADMKRKYTSAFYRDLLERVVRMVPDVALGADVIVGFPGEGDSEFRSTVDLVQHSPLTHLHVFTYSPRPGTPASSMPHQVPDSIKKERSEYLRGLAAVKNLEFRQRFIGKELNIVLENKQEDGTGLPSGLTDNYIRVAVFGAKSGDIGKEVPVRIESVSESRNFGIARVTI